MKKTVRRIFLVGWIIQFVFQACNHEARKRFALTLPRKDTSYASIQGKQQIAAPITDDSVFTADISYGKIGIIKAGEKDRAFDNIFHIIIPRQLKPNEEIRLVYDLKGVADHASLCRSINDGRAVGGHCVRFSTTWTKQQEAISKSSLHIGDNVIRFSIPDSARYTYEVRGVHLVTRRIARPSPVLVDKITTSYRGCFQLKGAVNEPGELLCNGKPLAVQNGEFEALLSGPQVKLEFSRANGRAWRTILVLPLLAPADTIFTGHARRSVAAGFYKKNEGLSLATSILGAAIHIPEGALPNNEAISITPLQARDVAPLNSDMVNVTGSADAYRFLPHGSHFNKPVHLNLPYDSLRLPEGYTKEDIHTFYFDENKREWVALPNDTTRTPDGLVAATSTHFTDMIAGIIKVPESPQTQGYTPTSIKDYKAADPSAGIPMIPVPTANAMGNAAMSFPIKIPKGRNGMQPNLNLSYSSDSGNSWLGLGWNLPVAFIGIDTRWGVPRYDPANETETYTLNGEQLAPLTNHAAFVGRVQDLQFHKRIEGSFEKIVRHGDSPTNYWWQVTNKYGVSSYYGGKPGGVVDGAVLKDAFGNIAQWMLVETHDLHDNYVTYQYTKTLRNVVQGGSLKGSQIYLSTIRYTAWRDDKGKYSVQFFRDSTTRQDIEVSGRLGLLTVSADRLAKIEVYDQNGKLFRSYNFDYKHGVFNKSLLIGFNEADEQKKVFYTYGLRYFDDVATSGGAQLGATENWSPSTDGVKGGFPNILPGFTDESSTLNTSKSRSSGAGLTLTAGISPGPVPLPNKDFTVGGNVSFETSESDGLVSMIDINGDGLPDKVFKKGGGVFYRPNLGLQGHRFGDVHTILGISSFNVGKSSTNKKSIQVYPPESFIGYETSTTKQTTDTYFADFNGDGLIDLASGGQVYFNHINSNGDPEFTLSSTPTPNPIAQGALDNNTFLKPDLALQQEQELQYPLEDAVRFWQAPFSGNVDISGLVKLLPPAAGIVSSKDDGVRVSIDTNGATIWSTSIQTADYSTKTPVNVTGIPVVKGQRIFFRVQSVYNGNDDVVQWDPLISYAGTGLKDSDANNRQYSRYKASEDFVLDNRNGVIIPQSGTIRIAGVFSKLATSDTVNLVVRKCSNKVWTELFRKKFGPHAVTNGNLIFKDTMLNAKDILTCSIETDSYIDRAALSWTPHYQYIVNGLPEVDANGSPLLDVYIAPANKNHNDLKLRSQSYQLGQQTAVAILPDLATIADTGLVVFTVKGPDTIYAKRFITFSKNGVTGTTDSIYLTLEKGQPYFFDFACSNPSLATALALDAHHNNALVFYEDGVPKKTDKVAAGLYTEPVDLSLGTMFRGWGQFQYKGDNGDVPIDESKLTTNQWANYPNDPTLYTDPNSIANLPNPVLIDVASMYADSKRGLWAGMDTSVIVSATNMGSSRLFMHDVSVDVPISGVTLTSVSKIRKSKATTISAGVNFSIAGASGSSSSSSETTELDMMDMNGDRYPDVIDASNIQYTQPSGQFQSSPLPYTIGSATAKGTSLGIGPGGQFAPAPSNNTTMGNGVVIQEQAHTSISLPGTVNKNDQQTTSTWVDVNGDGLPDKLKDDGTVSLNLGYTFAAPEDWHIGGIDKNQGISIGAGKGFNLFESSFEAGFGLTRSTGSGSYTLADVNGDGLVDQVYSDGVQLNNGNSFASKIPWSALTHFNDNVSTGESINGAYTYVIPIDLFFVTIKICINPSVFTSWGLSREQYQIMDIDGDGFPDLLHSENDGDLQVNRSTIGRSNLLMQVDRPMRSSIVIDYARTGNTYAMPENKWVMTLAKLVDSVGGNGADTMRYAFKYADGFYNRREREFYGFKTVTTNELNTLAKGAIYRSTVQQFLNRNYYTKGLADTVYMANAGGNKYTQTTDTYQLRFVQDSVYYPALRQTTTQHYEGQGGAPAQTAVYYDYDALGNMTLIDDIGDGTAGDDMSAAVTYFSVDPQYIKAIPKSIVVSNQGTVKRKRAQEIDNNTGDITKISQFLADGSAAVYDMQYDQYGNLIQITRPANKNKERLWYKYTYEDTVQTYVRRVDDAYGYFSTSDYDLRYGLVTKSVSMTNEPMLFEYDTWGRMIRLTGPYEIAAGVKSTISFVYYEREKVPFAITTHYDPAHPTNQQGGIRIIHFMDGFGRTVQVKKDISLFVSKLLDKNAMSISGRVVYDAFGRVIKNYYPLTENFDAVQNNIFNPATGNFSDSTGYDVEDRPLKTVLADGSTTKYAYTVSSGDLLTSVTDPLNHGHEVLTDVRERKREDRALSGPSGPIITKFSYDALNELVKVEDAGGNVSSYTYDNLGRKISAKHPDNGTTSFVYDLAGNLTQKITAQIAKQIPNGGAINYLYDHERITGIDYPVQYQNKVTYQYGKPGTGDRTGRLILQEDASGGREFFYGKLGEITKEIRTVMVSSVFYTTYVSEQHYDTWNRLDTMKYQDGEVLSYKYNSGGTLSSITGTKFGVTTSYVDRIGYDEYEQRVYLKYGNNTETNYSYDPQRRRLTNLVATTASGRQMMNNVYSYDAVSNILNITNNTKAVAGKMGGYATYDYTYDGLYRLNTARGYYKGVKDSLVYGLSMGYDNLYNITTKRMTDLRQSYAYKQNYTYGGAGPHQLSAVGNDHTYTYDYDGNVTNGGKRQNYWDDEDRLMAVIKDSVLSEYTYDASGERVVKSSGGVQGIWVNNAPAGIIKHRDNYTVYVSPYLVCTRTGFTKHFYIESQRIATQVGKGKFKNISFPQTALSAGGINYIDRAKDIEKQRIAYYASLQPLIPATPTNKFYYVDPRNSGNQPPILIDTVSAAPPGWPGNTTPPVNGPPVFLDSIPSRASVKAGYGYESKDKTEETDRYFYHPDHLGSTNYITDGSGEVSQHYEYSAFGETFFDDPLPAGQTRTPYLFNAKEKDVETGLYYYGARYYDAKLSNWLSVDPMQDKYAGLSPYNYCLNNPVKLVDPNGKDVKERNLADNTVTGGIDLSVHITLNDGSIVHNPRTGNALQMPSGVSLKANIESGKWLATLPTLPTLSNVTREEMMINYFKPGGTMDYQRTFSVDKGKINPLYIDFGNYNYGVVAAAAGYSLNQALDAAAIVNGRNIKKDLLYSLNGDRNMITNPFNATRENPLFSNPRNNIFIINGYNDYKSGKLNEVDK